MMPFLWLIMAGTLIKFSNEFWIGSLVGWLILGWAAGELATLQASFKALEKAWDEYKKNNKEE